jgi:hypothetical protein
MARCTEPPRWQIWLAAFLIAVAFFGYLLPDRVFYGGDTARLYLSQQHALSTALQSGALPWWSPDIGAGYPLIAEGETAGLYPVNVALHALFAPEVLITVSVLLHLTLAGLGTAWLAQTIGISRSAALLSAVVYALGGFVIAHTSHFSVVSVSAWLPWLLLLLQRAISAPQPGRRAGYALGLGVVTALQFYAGHAQMSLLILLPVFSWACYLILAGEQRVIVIRRLLWPVLGIVAGTAAAAPQLLATLELASLSQRAGGLSSIFFTSYSFHPLLTATFFSPFLQGNPYPNGSIELMGYVGLVPLGLSWIALTQGRLKIRWLLAALGICGLLLAFGRSNPLYLLLERIPPFNLFRVPARYLIWTSSALALLAGMGLDQLQAGAGEPHRRGALFSGLAVTLAALAVLLALQALSADSLVALWRWLPLVHAGGLAIWLLGARFQTRSALWRVGMVLLCGDLFTYSQVLRATYNTSYPIEEVRAEPAVVDFLHADDSLYRVWTKETILPALSVQRESLYPNIAAAYGIQSANMYMPLVPRTYQDYVTSLDSNRLNRLNVRYYIIPQLLPVDEASELYDVLNPFAALPYDIAHKIDVEDVSAIRVESYVSHAADLPDGTLAATIVLTAENGARLRFPVRVGMETAEWAIDREDVAEVVRHSIAPLASTFPARSSYRNVAHPGHTYLGTWELDAPTRITGIQIIPALPEAYVRIERITFVTRSGTEVLASHLMGVGDHEIVYRTEDAVVYRNLDAWPRAYTVPLKHAIEANSGYQLADGLAVDTLGTVEVVSYENQRVTLRALVEEPVLLVLADMAYPGWTAMVDGTETPIGTVDGLFRGIALSPGDHFVEFEYRP